MTYFASYHFQAGRTLVETEDGEICDFCERIEVTKVISMLMSEQVFVGISITRTDGSVCYCEYPRSAIVDNPTSVFANIGLSVSTVREYVITVMEILFETEKTARWETRHTSLGFWSTEGNRAFLYRSVLGGSVASVYYKSKKIAMKGNFTEWRDEIARHGEKRPELMLALAIGASAPVAALLKELSLFDGTAVFALIGESSSGKTTALRTMASIWGRPTISDGVIDSFVSTEAYFFSELGRKKGFPHFVDEVSAQPRMDLTQMMYTISLGRERGRCKPDGTPRDRNEWSGTVVFTGENSMFMQTNRNRGLYARLLEFSFRWTAGAEQAEDLNRFTAKHYGSAAEPLIETILAMSDQEVEELFREVQTGVFEALQPQNGVERRVMDLYSVIVMSAVIAQEAWKMPFDLPAIMGLLKDHHKRNEAVKDRAEIVYESIKQQIMENWDRFPEDATKSYLSSVWGERGKYKQDNCVWITADRFEKFLKCAGEENVKTALEPLHTKGWLVKYGDRYKKPHRMGTMEIKCYCILLENTGPSRQSTRPKPVHSNRQALLEE